MTEEKKIRWYIKPKDDQANDDMYNTMTKQRMTIQETSIKYKGENLAVYETNKEFVDFLAHSRVGLPLRYRVFWEDEFGAIREWFLHERVVKKRAKGRRWGKAHGIPDQKKKVKFPVIEATPDLVELRIDNIHCRFGNIDGKVKLLTKFDPEKQIYDPQALHIEDNDYIYAIRQAAAIMAGRRKCAVKKAGQVPPKT
jgi:hypothetical protein